MKKILERIWNEGGCRCPSHIIWWNNTSGYHLYGIFYRPGRKWRR